MHDDNLIMSEPLRLGRRPLIGSDPEKLIGRNRKRLESHRS